MSAENGIEDPNPWDLPEPNQPEPKEHEQKTPEPEKPSNYEVFPKRRGRPPMFINGQPNPAYTENKFSKPKKRGFGPREHRRCNHYSAKNETERVCPEFGWPCFCCDLCVCKARKVVEAQSTRSILEQAIDELMERRNQIDAAIRNLRDLL